MSDSNDGIDRKRKIEYTDAHRRCPVCDAALNGGAYCGQCRRYFDAWREVALTAMKMVNSEQYADLIAVGRRMGLKL